MKTIKFLSIGIWFLSALACSNQNFQTIDSTEQVKAKAVYSTEVDVLWVVDTSSETMELHQNRIAKEMSSFYDGLIANKADFRIAATTMNMGGGGGCSSPSDDGKFLGSVPVVTKATSNPVARLQELIKRGGDGCNAEVGLRAMRTALEREYSKGKSSQFLRKDALLVVVFVTDDDDFSPGTKEDYKNFLDSLKGQNEVNSQKWIANYIGITDLNDPLCTTYGDYSATSAEYAYLAENSGGVVESICKTDFSSYVNQINVRLKSVLNKYKLDSYPILDSLTVYINGVLIRKDAVNGWTYDEASNSIILNGNAKPGPNDDVEIKYEIKEF